MWKNLLAKAQKAKLNEFTESEVSELTSRGIDEIALAILKRDGSQGITIVSSQRIFILVCNILSISIHLTDTMLYTGNKGHYQC
jgi:hypothetical protein